MHVETKNLVHKIRGNRPKQCINFDEMPCTITRLTFAM